MKKFQYLFSSFLLFFSIAKGQDGLIRQYQFNQLSFNPAFAGENGIFSVKTLLGQQFNGTLRFNQVNQVLAIDGQLFNQGGLAFQAYRSNLGNVLSRGLLTSYSKGFDLGELLIKGGINGGLMITNIVTNAVNMQVAPFAGMGFLASYKGVFAGVSKPMLIYSKNVIDKKPAFIQLGYIYSPQSSLLNFNVNSIFYTYSNKNNIDFNAKAWYNQRVGLGVSVRNDKIYNYFEKNLSVVPSIEYKLYKTVHVGISYDKNEIRDIGATNPTLENDLNFRGVFQLFFRYTSNPEQGESKFYNKF
ncbi:MAG: type IX secretion system membrane protein PorP/SprF [Cytophagaceae bacterium]|nr:type IX secretion system membrane protein PorP/SprF [Cytophagaceae bacterium]MBL0301199.1 type IX secretion system membrane protein PorP/SprF [Cytophagaceae bacterium]MBL0324016.1 type IX secretion system membrane protein PorP/SprF [Cytophagaceae bacterium]